YVLNNPTTLTDPVGLQGCPAGTSEIGPGQCAGPLSPLVDPVWQGLLWNDLDLLQVFSGWSLEYQGTIELPQTVGPEGELYGGYDVDVWFAYPQYGVLLDPSLSATNIGPLQQMAERANAIIVRVATQPNDVNTCTQEFLMNKGGPGAQKLVADFSLYNFSRNYWTTALAETSRYGLWGLGYALGLNALKVAGAAIALASGGATGAATIMDAEARHACGEPVVP